MVLTGQGPSFFDADFVSVSNVDIIDGKSGRALHFAIHGNFPRSESVHMILLHMICN